MSEQDEALRLADEFERSCGAWDKNEVFSWAEDAEGCLRRLTAENERLTAERDVLLDAVRKIACRTDEEAQNFILQGPAYQMRLARAALAQIKEQP